LLRETQKMNEGRKIRGKEYYALLLCALFRKINFLRWLSTFRGQSSKSSQMSDSIQITLVRLLALHLSISIQRWPTAFNLPPNALLFVVRWAIKGEFRER